MGNDETTGLKFSIKAHWVPLYINGKLIAGRIIPLHKIDDKTYRQINERGQQFLQNFFYSECGLSCDKNDRQLTPAEFLEKNQIVCHASIVSYDKTLIVLGYDVFHYRCTKMNPPEGIHIDYFSSLPVNYPNEILPAYLGGYGENGTYYRARGIGRATIALASSYAEEMHPGHDEEGIAVDLTARADDDLIKRRYISKYGFKLYRGRRGRENDLFLSYKRARAFLNEYINDYEGLVRPEGNGITYRPPFGNQ